MLFKMHQMWVLEFIFRTAEILIQEIIKKEHEIHGKAKHVINNENSHNLPDVYRSLNNVMVGVCLKYLHFSEIFLHSSQLSMQLLHTIFFFILQAKERERSRYTGAHYKSTQLTLLTLKFSDISHNDLLSYPQSY